MPDKKIPDVFDVQVFGDIEPINQTISKARCRVFYKYANRNGGYITDDFAEKLLSTVAYAPVKGIFDADEGDFADHGWSRTEGKIYGVVAADPNVTWEKHKDEDGIEREYACVDVLLFSALYPVAETIVGKSQSMELYSPSIQGDWKTIGDNYYYVYTDACFLGLQVLGDKVEPCFEGAAFFSLVEKVQELVEEMSKYAKSQQVKGGISMDKKEIFDAEIQPVEEAPVEEVAAEEPVEEAEVVEEAEEAPEAKEVPEAVENAELDEDGKGEEDENVEENAENSEEEPEEVAEEEQPETENVEAPEENATLNTESVSADDVQNLTEELKNATARIAELEAENNALKEFKLAVEKAEKEDVLKSYEDMLSEEVIEKYSARIDEFTVIQLDKELAYELKQSGAFAKAPETDGLMQVSEPETSGLEGILSKYKK